MRALARLANSWTRPGDLRSRTSFVIWDRASISIRRSCIGFSGRSSHSKPISRCPAEGRTAENAIQFLRMGLNAPGTVLVIAAGVAVAFSGRTAAQSPEPLRRSGQADRFRARRAAVAARQLLRLSQRVAGQRQFPSRSPTRFDPNRVGANGARIVAGNSEASRLYQRISARRRVCRCHRPVRCHPSDPYDQAVDRARRRLA